MKTLVGAVGVIILIVAGKIAGDYFFGFAGGLIGALIGAALGGYALKRSGYTAANSALVSETQGVRTAKYIVLAVVLVGLAGFTYLALGQ